MIPAGSYTDIEDNNIIAGNEMIRSWRREEVCLRLEMMTVILFGWHGNGGDIYLEGHVVDLRLLVMIMLKSIKLTIIRIVMALLMMKNNGYSIMAQLDEELCRFKCTDLML